MEGQTRQCNLKAQGGSPGSCLVQVDSKRKLACRATLREMDGQQQRLITSVHLSRPENYLSIYQSGCNFSCRKCHSWSLSKVREGRWYSPEDVLKDALQYQKMVTLTEPRERVTAWHAHDSCRCCGSCVLHGSRSPSCPAVLDPEAILFSPQGFGPARNIVGFTGGDLTCCPEFYSECARRIKEHTDLWVLIETNGYGLTDQNLDLLRAGGVDAFWLDIKAYDPQVHQWLTGCTNERILQLPGEILQRGFVLEVLSLYIPGLVETDQLVSIARVLKAVDPAIPFTILAFFPEHKMKTYNSPTVREMVDAYRGVKSVGLSRIRLGNLGIFLRCEEDQEIFMDRVDPGAY